jgi:hypothetical protein
MEFLPPELLINIIDNIWNIDTLINLQQTNKVLYDCVNSSNHFNLLKECLNDERWNKWYMPKLKKEKIYVIGCIKGILGIVREYSKNVDRNIIIKGFIHAAENGHLHVLKWLKNTYNIIDEEAKSENNTAFINAAGNGHLHILKWLKVNFNITEQDAKSKTNLAFIKPVVNGNLEILKWLKETFKMTKEAGESKEYYKDAINFAVRSGHLYVLKWLKENFK